MRGSRRRSAASYSGGDALLPAIFCAAGGGAFIVRQELQHTLAPPDALPQLVLLLLLTSLLPSAPSVKDGEPTLLRSSGGAHSAQRPRLSGRAEDVVEGEHWQARGCTRTCIGCAAGVGARGRSRSVLD
jgi:hypothetical protein